MYTYCTHWSTLCNRIEWYDAKMWTYFLASHRHAAIHHTTMFTCWIVCILHLTRWSGCYLSAKTHETPSITVPQLRTCLLNIQVAIRDDHIAAARATNVRKSIEKRVLKIIHACSVPHYDDASPGVHIHAFAQSHCFVDITYFMSLLCLNYNDLDINLTHRSWQLNRCAAITLSKCVQRNMRLVMCVHVPLFAKVCTFIWALIWCNYKQVVKFEHKWRTHSAENKSVNCCFAVCPKLIKIMICYSLFRESYEHYIRTHFHFEVCDRSWSGKKNLTFMFKWCHTWYTASVHLCHSI